uniref:Uncharacterized protein n=1 Tax=Timema poppense TaxID=170557 RepID=A0A7R9CK39_TIMPO|nr:unnamed protein product [Timema poppensis]
MSNMTPTDLIEEDAADLQFPKVLYESAPTELACDRGDLTYTMLVSDYRGLTHLLSHSMDNTHQNAPFLGQCVSSLVNNIPARAHYIRTECENMTKRVIGVAS